MTIDATGLLWKISWQAAVLAAIVWIVARLAKKSPASWRYALWVMVLIKFIIPPFAYLPEQMAFWNRPQLAETSVVSTPMQQPTATVSPTSAPTTSFSAPAATTPVSAPMIEPTPYAPTPVDLTGTLFWTWFVGVMVMGLVLAVRMARQSRMVRRASPVDAQVDDLLADCASRLGSRRIPLLLQSDHAPTPMLVGVFRPVILLPSGLSDTCPESELKAILLHELAHIKRRDMAVLWLYHIIQLAFFFNPALWLAGRQLKRERELACDELVLASDSITRRDYAAGYVSALKMAATSARAPISLAMAEPFEMEKRRLHCILTLPLRRLSPVWIVALVVVCAVGLPTWVGCAKDPNVPVTRVQGDFPMLKYGTPLKSVKRDGATIVLEGIGRVDGSEITRAGKPPVKLDMALYLNVRTAEGEAIDSLSDVVVDHCEKTSLVIHHPTGWPAVQGIELEVPPRGTQWLHGLSGKAFVGPVPEERKITLTVDQLRLPIELWKGKLTAVLAEKSLGIGWPAGMVRHHSYSSPKDRSRYLYICLYSMAASGGPEGDDEHNVPNPEVTVSGIMCIGKDGRRVSMQMPDMAYGEFDPDFAASDSAGNPANRHFNDLWLQLGSQTRNYGLRSQVDSTFMNEGVVPADFQISKIELTITRKPNRRWVRFSIPDIPIPKEFWEKPKVAIKARQQMEDKRGFLLKYTNPPSWRSNEVAVSVLGIGQRSDRDPNFPGDMALQVRATAIALQPGYECKIKVPASMTTDKGLRADPYGGYSGEWNQASHFASALLCGNFPSKDTRSFTELRGQVIVQPAKIRRTYGPVSMAAAGKPHAVEHDVVTMVVAGWGIGDSGRYRDSSMWALRNIGADDYFLPEYATKGSMGYLNVVVRSVSPAETANEADMAECIVYDARGHAVEMEDTGGDSSQPYDNYKPSDGDEGYYGLVISSDSSGRPMALAVDPKGPAWRAGLRAGDGITSFNNEKVAKAADITVYPSSTPLPLVVIRNGVEKSIRVVPESQPLLAHQTEPSSASWSALMAATNVPWRQLSYTRHILSSTHRVPKNFVPARVVFKWQMRGVPIKHIPFTIHNIPIPAELWQQAQR